MTMSGAPDDASSVANSPSTSARFEASQACAVAPISFVSASRLPVERAASRWIVSDYPEQQVEAIRPYVELGFRHLVFHAPGPDQARFLQLFGEQVLPRIRRAFG